MWDYPLAEITSLLDRGAPIAPLHKNDSALITAANSMRNDVVSLLLDRGADVNMVDSYSGTALAVAVMQGNKDIVRLLLDRGADVNIVGGKVGTALAAAAIKGNKDTLKLLLDRGADVNIVVDSQYGTALAAAAFEGNKSSVRLLLDRGADVNIVGGEYGTALTAAALEGNKDTVRLLLDQGADVNIVGGEYGTALAAAVLDESEDTVRLLLDRGADVNMVGGKYGTALAAAATIEGNDDIVQLLLDRGADVNMVGGEYGTALATAAAIDGNNYMVQLLLDRGADVNMVVDSKYGTALAAAAYKGNTGNVQLLLDRGADVNVMVDSKYGTALAAAALVGDTDSVSLLLEQGADVNTVSGEHGTALAAAAFMGQTTTMSLLLDHGADVNMVVDSKYGTALAAAAYKGNKDIASLLLDRGGDVNMVVDGKYGTALAAAAYKGNTDTMSLLLDRGADVNIVGGKYGTALAAAAFREEVETVSLLLDRGANVNMVGGEFGTALGATTLRRESDTVSLLIDRGADINLVIGSRGTLLGRAIYEGILNIELLLELGADVTHVGGSYPTSSGVYPSALDVAHSEGSSTDPTSLMLLISKQKVCTTDSNLANNATSRPPYPMPYTRPDSTLYATRHKDTLPPGKTSEDQPDSEFCAGGNITPEQADVLCQVGEVHWRSLAALVGLHEDTIQAKQKWIQNDVCYFVACNYDFGLAYAAARVAWAHFNETSVDCNGVSVYRGQWHKHARMLDEGRLQAIKIDSPGGQELIVSPYSIMPRRLWDLISNRVVDFRMLHAAQSTTGITTTPTFWAVTHGWTSDMTPICTAINQYQWPVPFPKDISLESVRSELLTLGAEYVWIDVLCLRQKSEVDYLEKLRVEEWKLDVPTIGNVYRAATNIVRYFNGLGVPFRTQGWDGPRHWLQRAWTLQEIADENTTINGGIPRDEGKVLLNTSGEVLGKVIKLRSALRPVLELAAQVDCASGCELYELAREMSRRHATQPVDKLAGLFYLLRTTKLPCYDAKKTSEDIWKQCFYLLPLEQKAQILFTFPYRASEEQWFPTWAQVLDWPVRDPEYYHIRPSISLGFIKAIPEEVPLFINNIQTISNATLIETDNPSEYQVKINNSLFSFYQPYLLQKPINIEDHPVFTLAAIQLGHGHNWLVCRAATKYHWVGADVVDLGVAEFKILKKVGVLRTDTSSELLVRGLVQSVDCLFI